MSLIDLIVKGDRRSLSKLISLVENDAPELATLMAELYRYPRKASRVVGITGPPGAGKSTLISKIISYIRTKGEKIAVLAVDPSSPFSGGALLGDRIRMQSHANDSGVFIRSLGSRGSYGGLSYATKSIVRILQSSDFDLILIETVGVGQTELSIMNIADTTLVMLVPESGDTIQTLKAGLLEIADIFVVNKSDRPGAEDIKMQLTEMTQIKEGPWSIPVLKLQANEGVGIKELWEAVINHGAFLEKYPETRDAKKKQELWAECLEILAQVIKKKIDAHQKSKKILKIFNDVKTGKKDPYSAALALLEITYKPK